MRVFRAAHLDNNENSQTLLYLPSLCRRIRGDDNAIRVPCTGFLLQTGRLPFAGRRCSR